MSAAFTPGPWELRPAMARDALVLGAGEVGFAIFEQFDGEPSAAQVSANAVLAKAAPSLHDDAEFLCARIRELEGEMTDDDELSRQYFGHVLPAVARMESTLREARGDQ